MEQTSRLAFAYGLLVLAASAAITVVVQRGAGERARAQLAGEQQYRQLVQAHDRNQQEIRARLDALAPAVDEIRQRVTRLEQILEQVD